MSTCNAGGQLKRRFSSAAQADKALNSIWRKAIKGTKRSPTMPCRFYRCRVCKGFHFTKTPLREGQSYLDEP